MNEKKKIAGSFLLGIAVGGLVAGPATHFFMRWSGSGTHGERGAQHHKRLVKEFTKKLDLGEEQKAQIERVLDNKRLKIEELREQIRPKFKELRESARIEIRAMLRPDQIEKFDQIADQHEKQWEQKRR